MYAISKRQRDEALYLLAVLKEQTGGDVRSVNNRRKAGILIRQLEKAREIEYNDVKNLVKTAK